MKISYKKSFKKRVERNKLLGYYPNKSIVGLCGPDIDDYYDECKKAGFSHMTFYENNLDVVANHLSDNKKILDKVDYHYDDILNCDFKPNTTYDLDFTQRIDSVAEHIRKFEDNFIITVCERGVPQWYSVGRFLEIKKETVLYRELVNSNLVRVETFNNRYSFALYADKNPMVIIHKIIKK